MHCVVKKTNSKFKKKDRAKKVIVELDDERTSSEDDIDYRSLEFD